MPIYRVIRITMPDRPGALSAVTASLAAHGVDIVRLDVVSHDGGIVADDLLLAAESDTDISRAVAGFLPEVSVGTFDALASDPTIEMAAGLRDVAGAPAEEAGFALVGAARGLMRADHAALLTVGAGGEIGVTAATCALPAIDVEADFAGRWVLARGEPAAFPATTGWAPAAVEAALGAAWIAMAPCGDLRLLVVGRVLNIAFYTGELERLHAFAEAAHLVLGLKGDRLPYTTAPAGLGVELPPRAVVLQSRVAVA